VITSEQCLQHVVTLVEADEARALPLATGYIDAFVPMVCADRVKGARMLSGLRVRPEIHVARANRRVRSMIEAA
jgi:hypothetical protein